MFSVLHHGVVDTTHQTFDGIILHASDCIIFQIQSAVNVGLIVSRFTAAQDYILPPVLCLNFLLNVVCMMLDVLPSDADLRGWTLLDECGDGRTGTVYGVRPSASIVTDMADNAQAVDEAWSLDQENNVHSGPAPPMSPSSSRYVVKIVPFYRSSRAKVPLKGIMQRFAVEQKMATWSGRQGLGPRVVTTWRTERWGFIVMEQWDMTLSDWKRQHRIHRSLHDGNGHLESENDNHSLGAHSFSGSNAHSSHCTTVEDVRQKLRHVVSMAKRAGHRDIKDANIMVCVDPKDSRVVCRVGVIDWDKVDPQANILKTVNL